MHYCLRLELDKMLKLRYEKETMKKSGLLKYVMIEVCFNMLICPPYVDIDFEILQLGGTLNISLDGIFFSIALLRFYLLLRLYEQYSTWTSEKAISIW